MLGALAVLYISSLSMNGLNQTETAVFTLLMHLLLPANHITMIYWCRQTLAFFLTPMWCLIFCCRAAMERSVSVSVSALMAARAILSRGSASVPRGWKGRSVKKVGCYSLRSIMCFDFSGIEVCSNHFCHKGIWNLIQLFVKNNKNSALRILGIFTCSACKTMREFCANLWTTAIWTSFEKMNA